MEYADLGGALGLWMPSWWPHLYDIGPYSVNTIYIDTSLSTSWSNEKLATIMIHEALHADYTHNTEKWVLDTTLRLGVDRSDLNWSFDPVAGEDVLEDSIDQEYQAFQQEAVFWKEVKGSQSDPELDYILALYEEEQALGTDVLYQAIARTYVGYPPYAKVLK